MAEYDFALKNISDEFQAAENEIIDEFTAKRKRRTESKYSRDTMRDLFLISSTLRRIPRTGKD